MSSKIKERNLFEVANARNMQPEEVASTFVPTDAFYRLLTPMNHIVLGARGSGKTALARMLSHDHLSIFNNADTLKLIAEKKFVGVYIPMKLEWVSGLRNKPWQNEAEKEEFFQWRLNIATCNALLNSIKSCLKVYFKDPAERAITENAIVSDLSEDWLDQNNQIKVSSIASLQTHLRRVAYKRQRQLEVNRTNEFNSNFEKNDAIGAEFGISLFEPLKHGIFTAAQHLEMDDSTTWLICLDEAEFLDETHHRILNSYLRSHSENIFFKITTMPYKHYTLETNTDAALKKDDDFEYIYIDQDPTVLVDSPEEEEHYDRIQNGASFVRQIFESRNLKSKSKSKYSGTKLSTLLGTSPLIDPEEFDPSADSEFMTLAMKHCSDQVISRINRHMNNIKKASSPSDLKSEISAFSNAIGRRLKGALKLREEVELAKGAKKLDIYSGFNLFVRCCDGNPRRIVRLLNKIRLNSDVWDNVANQSPPIVPRNTQYDIFVSVARSYIGRLVAEKEIGPELHEFLIQVGNGLNRILHEDKITMDSCSFEIPTEIYEKKWPLIEQAIGVGLIYPVLPKGVIYDLPEGHRQFRLAYILAPHFKLLPRRGIARSLQVILDKADENQSTFTF